MTLKQVITSTLEAPSPQEAAGDPSRTHNSPTSNRRPETTREGPSIAGLSLLKEIIGC